jgi:DNA-binding HxlR family transcriptional regulator
VKRYGQVCPLARALDVVGERWSLLIVRELSVGPRRYSDLVAGLPGIPTNLLASRLRELQAAGVISKSTLPRPGVASVYELTKAGLALRPAIAELRKWGADWGSRVAETDEKRPAWALLSAAGRPTTMPDGKVCALMVDSEVFYLTARQSTVVIHNRPTSWDASITMPIDDFYRYLSNQPIDIPTIAGDSAIARAALGSLRGALIS